MNANRLPGASAATLSRITLERLEKRDACRALASEIVTSPAIDTTRARANLGPCRTCGGAATLHVDHGMDSRIPGMPSGALAYCTVCGSRGPQYYLPLVWPETEPAPTWDPRERAAAAWNGEFEPARGLRRRYEPTADRGGGDWGRKGVVHAE